MSRNVIETARLYLRPTAVEDIEPWAQMMADEETARFIGGVQAPSTAWRGVMSMAGAWALTGVAMFSVVEKATGRFVGRLGPWQPRGWPGPEVGWTVIRDVWGKGYATEGATAAIDYAFDVLGWDKVIHCIDPDNHASRRVAERLGSRLLRMARMPPPFDQFECQVWGQTRDDWRRRAADQIAGQARRSSPTPAA